MNKLFELFKQAYLKFGESSVTEIAWVIAGQTLSVVLGFIIIKILSGLGTEQYGVYVLVLTAAAFAGSLFYGPLTQGFLRFYYTYSEKNKQTLFSKYFLRLLFFLCLLVLASAVIFTFANFAFPFYKLKYFFLITGIFVAALKFNEFFNSVLNLLRKLKLNSILQCIEKTISILLLVLLLKLNVLDIETAVIILAAAALIFGSGKFLYFKKLLPAQQSDNPKQIQNEIKSILFPYVIPFVLWGVSAWLQLNGEKWIINEYLSTSDVGIYGVMMAVVNSLVVIPNNIIVEFAMPIIFKYYADLKQKQNIITGYIYIKLIFILVLFLTVGATLVSFFAGSFLIKLISNDSFATFSHLLPSLTLGTGLFFTGQALTNLGMALNKPGKYLAPKIAVGILSVILNLILIKIFGIEGVSYSVLISGAVYVFYIWIVNN
ncbi:MAG: oligosaccharide flippase family protein, partial [Ignavibacteriaceae bacterium]|nr:oligosaccharide flippase family protein [Ignavibacteriaceae bacterium]